MLELTIKGFVTGFILAIMVGPVFFVLLETSIRRGVRAALAFDFGVLLSDLFYILIAYLFYSEVSSVISGERKDLMKLIGGTLFLVYGFVSFFKPPKRSSESDIDDSLNAAKDYVFLAVKGFLLNFANPMVIFYWFSVITLGAKNSPDGESDWLLLYFLIVLLLTFFSFDVLKIFGAKMLRPLVTDRVLRTLNQFIGIVFVIFGVFLIIQGISVLVK
ncbi:MAG: LysE family translocator [Cryomorphaceae bacterium]|jgi:threonine/homoserine/homoserine lactone efflux protein|nr:LysE family translocator [Cryomorphaceae bacterium]